MDDEFENIILDEVDDLNGLESLREKTVKNKDNNNINNSKDQNKKINNNKKENESKEISEEYNDFDYNIEENEDNKIMNENNLNNISNEKIKKIEQINSDNKKEKEEKKCNSKNKEDELIKEKNDNKENDSLNAIKIIEDNYISLKNELEIILTKVEFNEIKEISEQNNQLMKYVSQLDEIMNSIIKIFPKGEKLLIDKISKIRKLEKKKTREEKEKKILDIYKNEYIDLEKKYKLIKDPIYKESLINILNKLKRKYEIITEENKNLKEEQKMSEIDIEKKSKNVKKEEKDVKRIEKDIKCIKSQIKLLKNKLNKNKINIIENNKRINKYVEKEKNLDIIAKEKYGIKEYQDVNLNQNITIKKFQEKKNSLKKIEIYEKGIETNKNKYERQIKNNEIIINELRKEKNNLLFYYKELIGEEKFRNIIDNFKEEEKNKNINKIEEINFKDNDDIILNQDLNINNEEIITKEKEKKYPEFLDFFKEEENNSDNNNDINININNDNNKMKDEKEINLEKLGEINNLSNRNKQSEDEPPPNEYEELEEFQI